MRNAQTVLLEALLVALLGLLFALAANAISPRGLRLSRNYFPGGEVPERPKAGLQAAGDRLKPAQPTNAGSSNLLETTLRRLQEHGLQGIEGKEVVELFRSVGYEQGLILMIDARDDTHYQAGHIPGAWQFDHYHAEQYLPSLLPLCLNAQKVVVYCNGGACEDSEFAAITLRDAGVPRERLFVYAGGISEWTQSGQPVESGARRSGQILKSTQ